MAIVKRRKFKEDLMKIKVTPTGMVAPRVMMRAGNTSFSDLMKAQPNTIGGTRAVIHYHTIDPCPDPDGQALTAIFAATRMTQQLKPKVNGRRVYTGRNAEDYVNTTVATYAIYKSILAFEKYASQIPDTTFDGQATAQGLVYGAAQINSTDFETRIETAKTQALGILNTFGVPNKFKDLVDKVIGYKEEKIEGTTVIFLSLVGAVSIYSDGAGEWTLMRLTGEGSEYPQTSFANVLNQLFDDMTTNAQEQQIAADMMEIKASVFPGTVSPERNSTFEDYKLFVANEFKGNSVAVEATQGNFTYGAADPRCMYTDSSRNPYFNLYAKNSSGEIEGWQLSGLSFSEWDETNNVPQSSIFGLFKLQLINQVNNGIFDSNCGGTLDVSIGEQSNDNWWLLSHIAASPDMYPSYTVVAGNGTTTKPYTEYVNVEVTPENYCVMWITPDQANQHLFLDTLLELYSVDNYNDGEQRKEKDNNNNTQNKRKGKKKKKGNKGRGKDKEDKLPQEKSSKEGKKEDKK